MAVKQEFASRFAKRKDELEWLFMELYHNREGLEVLEREMAEAYNARSAELKALDKARSADPEWYKRGNMFGMTMYTDLFAGNLKELAKKLPYLKEQKLTYLHLMPLLQMPHPHNDGGYAVEDFDTVQLFTHFLHPFTSASSYRNDAFFTFIVSFFTHHFVTVFNYFDRLYRCIKIEIYMIFHLVIQILKHHIVDICSKMTYRCVEKIQLVLQTKLLEFGSGCRIEFCSFPTVFHVDFIYILHQFYCLFLPDIFEQCSPEIIGNIIFPIRKCSCSPEAAHDRTSFTIDTALNFFPVNRTFSLFKRISLFKHGNLTFRLLFHQLIRRKNPSRTCSNNDHIIIHKYLLLLMTYI